MTKPTIPACKRCGACCRHLLVEAYALDALREPRLLEVGRAEYRQSLESLLDDEEGRCIIVAACSPCPFLGQDWGEGDLDRARCEIYSTRPNNCVGCLPGGESCKQAREIAEQLITNNQ